jgi:hypothetical protein
MTTNKKKAPYQGDTSDSRQILYEIENVKLYLFDIMKRLDALEKHYEPIVGRAIISPTMPNQFDAGIPELFTGPNKDKGQDYVRKNVAKILKNMIPQGTMDMMPKEVKEAYHNILSVMAPPNDPVWDKEPPKIDPREPTTDNPFQNTAKLWNNIADQIREQRKEEEAEEAKEPQSDPSNRSSHDEKTKARSEQDKSNNQNP